MAERMQRKLMAHYLDSSFGGETPSWYRVGKDLEEFSIELNPDTEQSQNIVGENVFTHNGYEVSADAEPFYARVGDALFERLQGIIDTLAQYDGCATFALEVHTWEAAEGENAGYVAYRQACYVVPTSYGGDTSGYQIPFTVHYTGAKVKGRFVPDAATGGGTFTPDA